MHFKASLLSLSLSKPQRTGELNEQIYVCAPDSLVQWLLFKTDHLQKVNVYIKMKMVL